MTTKTKQPDPRQFITIPVPPDLKTRFYSHCEERGQAPVKVLRLYIQKLLDEASKEG